MADQTENVMRFPKDVRITSITLKTKDNLEADLYYLFEELQIFENMEANVITGSISISDAINLPSVLNITGGENITISYRTAGLDEDTIVELFVYKISERFLTKTKHTAYILYLVSKEGIVDCLRKVGKSFKMLRGEEIVRDILSNTTYGMNSTKEIFIPTNVASSNDITCVVPFWSPMRTINWIVKRMQDQLSPNSAWRFFENKRGFVLSSISGLFNQTQTTIPTYIYGTRLSMSGQRDLEADFYTIETFNVKSTFDFIKGIKDGGFASKLYTYDVETKKYQMINFSIDDIALGDNTASSASTQVDPLKCFDGIPIAEAYASKISLFHKHRSVYDSGDEPLPESFLKNDYTTQAHLDQIKLEFTAAGNSQLNVGDIMKVVIHSTGSTSDDIEIDNYLSGLYLVTNIAHIIKKDNYSMIVGVTRNQFFNPQQSELEYGNNG